MMSDEQEMPFFDGWSIGLVFALVTAVLIAVVLAPFVDRKIEQDQHEVTPQLLPSRQNLQLEAREAFDSSEHPISGFERTVDAATLKGHNDRTSTTACTPFKTTAAGSVQCQLLCLWDDNAITFHTMPCELWDGYMHRGSVIPDDKEGSHE